MIPILKNYKRKVLPKNDRFRYIPRYYEGSEDENIYKLKSKFDRSEKPLVYNDFKGQWSKSRDESSTRANFGINTRLIVIIAILCLVFLYIIDFDLSIFAQ